MNFSIKKNVDLSSLSTFGIGGKAEEFVQVSTPAEIIEVLKWVKETGRKYHLFAGGSNVVFPDEGLSGVVIQIKGGNYAGKVRELIVEAGMGLSDVINLSIVRGLEGLETLSGIPGTIGGAVVGNAGAYGHSISEVVEGIEIWDGKIKRWLNRNECQFEYRESIFKKKPFIVLRVFLKFESGNKGELQKTSKEIIIKREAKYHPGIKCPGSFFKNVLVADISKKSLELIDQDVVIEGKIPAGYLLAEVGAKGMRVGGIEIAAYHGNLFINKGKGTAKDVKELAAILKKKVDDRFGIMLEEEIRYF
ncbi:UDP-N-acetylmuramate dehydrogenase [Candidatus Gottesmanbacteria bacterium]|nr:UDP-N-acetylmuramate dehydrogenase [Candidatus Gottesmanbacteria bacterium]